jgi:hypothetical protein
VASMTSKGEIFIVQELGVSVIPPS